MMINTIGIWSHIVPASQPCASGASVMFDGTGAGGRLVIRSFRISVSGHQIIRITTITVVICIIRRAFPLDS